MGSLYGKRFLDNKVKKLGLPVKERIQQWNIISGDTVQVIDGPEKGKIGKVLHVLRRHNKLIVQDVNVHVRSKKMTPVRAGFFYKTESPIHYSNVQLIDPIYNVPTKVKIGKDEAGKNVRYSALSGAVIPKLRLEFKRRDKSKLFNKKLDTSPEDVWKVTYKPFNANLSSNYLPPMTSQARKAKRMLQQVQREVIPVPRRR